MEHDVFEKKRLKNIGVNCGAGGFTLLELLISTALGGVILMGLLQLLLMSQQAYKTQSAQASLAESGEFFSAFMRTALQRAGSGFKGKAHLPYQSVTPIIWSMTEDEERFDLLTVQYVTGPEGGYTCTGSVADPNTTYVSQYAVIPFGEDESLSQLVCRSGKLAAPVSDTDSLTAKFSFKQTGIILSGVESFAVLYGITSGSDFVERFVTASEVDPLEHKVLMLEVGVLLSTTGEPVLFGLAKKNQPKTFQVLDQLVSVAPLRASSYQYRRVFEINAFLENAFIPTIK